MTGAASPSEFRDEFSFRTRRSDLKRLGNETFDLLVVGGGITGAAVARDAVSRGLTVALVEKADFASGTSSRSSKLIHGGLRYLENFEWKLVFEALSERSFLLRTAPHMVRPLKFYLPVYTGDAHGRAILDLGLWLYDLLALFRTPGAHRRLSAKSLLKTIPFLKARGLRGGFKYYDASMWDDRLVIEVLRDARREGQAVTVNYVEALSPLPGWQGMRVRDVAPSVGGVTREIDVRARKVIVCGGPWTDRLGDQTSAQWTPWLTPSKGVHLVFALDRLPVDGALVMSHPEDGRISFVIPRPDLGAGVTLVGTTDSATPLDPEKSRIEPFDVSYLMDLLGQYFPDLALKTSDILSAYVGVRPLIGPGVGGHSAAVQSSVLHSAGAAAGPQASTTLATSAKLQKVSREHHIGYGPEGSVWAAGGKYTTHRTMGREIVDMALKKGEGENAGAPTSKGSRLHAAKRSNTRRPINLAVLPKAVAAAKRMATERGWQIDARLWDLYGAEALDVFRFNEESKSQRSSAAAPVPAAAPDTTPASESLRLDPPGFPCLRGQFLYALQWGSVVRLEDFWFRRAPLYLSMPDHGEAWIDELAALWAVHTGGDAVTEARDLRTTIAHESAWKNLKLSP